MADTPDFEAEGLLDGLEDEDERAGRLELLEGLHERGVSIEELRRAIQEERLVLLPVELVFADGAEMTARQVAEQAGVELDWLLAQRQALGLPRPDPDAVMFSQEDVQAVKRHDGVSRGRVLGGRGRWSCRACWGARWRRWPRLCAS